MLFLQRLLGPLHSAVLFVLGSLALMQIFIYCYFGHKIRALSISIHSATYKAQWIRGSKGVQNAALMIANKTGSPQSLSQIGAPFFCLSFEFFTSVRPFKRKKK